MEIQDGRYFCKIVYIIADPQMYRTFESIKNCQRCDFLKIFVIPGGNATPHKFQRGDTSAPLPNRSGRYQGTTPTTWLNFNTPCKSQLKNAWPFSPTTTLPTKHDVIPGSIAANLCSLTAILIDPRCPAWHSEAPLAGDTTSCNDHFLEPFFAHH